MRSDIIMQVVPNVDPDFVRILETLPDPSPDAYETVVSSLPGLHGIFLRKRDASARGDRAAFAEAVDQEVALIESLERLR
jgi:hypothetical protein